MFNRFTTAELRNADPADLTPREQAWQTYFLDNPEVLASWGYSNDRWPPGYEDES